MMDYNAVESVLGKVASAYADACQRHPTFPAVSSNEPLGELEGLLCFIQGTLNKRDDAPECTIRSVVSEELLEAVIEGVRGNYAEAANEMLHVAATAVRAYEFYAMMDAAGKSAPSSIRALQTDEKNGTIRGDGKPDENESHERRGGVS